MDLDILSFLLSHFVEFSSQVGDGESLLLTEGRGFDDSSSDGLTASH